MSVSTKDLQANWASVHRILTIRNEREYEVNGLSSTWE